MCQLDTVFCAGLVLTKVVLEVESGRLDEVNTHLMYLELKQAACYLALICRSYSSAGSLPPGSLSNS